MYTDYRDYTGPHHGPTASPGHRTTAAVWLLCLAITALYVFCIPPWTDSDTANFSVYLDMLIKGQPLPTAASTVPQLLPILIGGTIWNLTQSVRALQLASITAFATALTCIFVAISRRFGALAGALVLAGALSSTRVMLMVLWGRSPTWAFLFLAIALLVFLHKPADEKRLHLTLLLSLCATCCRTDLIGLHGTLTALAVLDAAAGRYWMQALRLSLWGLGVLVPPVTDMLLAGTPFFTRQANAYFIGSREAFHIAMHGPEIPMPPSPSATALIRKGMRAPGYLFAYTYGLLAIPALAVIHHRSRKAAIAVLLITGSVALPGVILAWNGFYAARIFIQVHMVLTVLSGIGAACLLNGLCRHRRHAATAAIVLATAVMLLQVPAWRAHIRHCRKQAAEFNRHDRLAQRLAALPQGLAAPLVVEPAYLTYLYMLRLELGHSEVISKYDLAHRLHISGQPPTTLTWIGGEPPQQTLPRLDIATGTVLIEHDGIRVTACQLRATAAE